MLRAVTSTNTGSRTDSKRSGSRLDGRRDLHRVRPSSWPVINVEVTSMAKKKRSRKKPVRPTGDDYPRIETFTVANRAATIIPAPSFGPYAQAAPEAVGGSRTIVVE